MDIQHKLVELLQRRPDLWNDLFPLIADQVTSDSSMEAEQIRLTWGPKVIQIEELPKKPIDPNRKYRRFKVDLSKYVDQKMDRFQGSLVVLEGKITPELTYDQAISRVKDHIQNLAVDYSTEKPEYAEDYYEIENIEPVSEQPLEIDGGNFKLTVEPDSFRFHSPRQEGLYADPSIVSQNPEGAEKIYNIIQGDKTFFHSFSWEEVPPWLSQNKISYRFVYR